MFLLYEEIKNPINKKKFREMAKRFHPDAKGDEETMKRINSADTDKAVEDLYNELMGGKKEEKPKEEKPKKEKQEWSSPKDAPFGSSWSWSDKESWKDHFSSQKERDEWHEKVKRKRAKRSAKERQKQRG